jgi:hypothetical protein
MAAPVTVSVALDALMVTNMEKRARSMGIKTTAYVRQLIEAAYAARVGAEKGLPPTDARLDEAVRAVFALSGEFSCPAISRVTGLSVELVNSVLKGFKIVASEISARGEQEPQKMLPPPERRNGVDKTVRVGEHVQAAGFTQEEQAELVRMWAEGVPASDIGVALGSDGDAVRQWAQQHRDLCEARDSKTSGKAAAEHRKRKSTAWPDDLVEKVRTMWANNIPTRQIAIAIGKTEGNLSVWASNHREVCPKRGHSWKPPAADAAREAQ